MDILRGKGTTKFGKGIDIKLTGNEVANAIYAYLAAHDIKVNGAATITVNGELCEAGNIYVDPSGHIVVNGEKIT